MLGDVEWGVWGLGHVGGCGVMYVGGCGCGVGYVGDILVVSKLKLKRTRTLRDSS